MASRAGLRSRHTGVMRGEGAPLSPGELRRYGRHLVLPEVGPEGQARLGASRVLLVGAGGLGSPLALYLAAAGVGRIGLVDFDHVDESNLQRQILYGVSDVGRPKLEAAAERLAEINPHVEVVCHETAFDERTGLDLVAAYDVVADGTDNFPTRYLVNDACVLRGRPNVFGSILRFEGRVSVFWPGRGPCYRCLFPEPPPPGLVPSCAEGGVLGVLPGVIGSLQATEVLKILLGIGRPLVGRILTFDALATRFRELTLERDPACPICSDEPSITGLVATGDGCAVPEPPDAAVADAPAEIGPRTLHEWRTAGRPYFLLDVREPIEHRIARIDGAHLVPLGELPVEVGTLDPAVHTVVMCHHGHRSARAAAFLRQAGFARVTNLAGGIEAWSLEVDPTVARY